jgi:small subunit ribosomal protein S3
VGQKTHPKGFRLVTTQEHLSKWYSNKLTYPTLIEEDFFIRTKVNQFFEEFLSISKVEITRIQQDIDQKEYVNITIHALFPRAKDMYKKVTKYFSETSEGKTPKTVAILNNSKGSLKRFVSLLFKRNIRNLIRLLQIKTGTKFIADQLEKRVPFRRAVKQTIKKVQLTSMKGVKVEVSGRLNGIEIARSEWKRDGKIPLHTLRAKIDYTHQEAQTIYGVIGIKVWLFAGEID